MTFDPDFGKVGFARDLFRLRFRTLKVDQKSFADRFALSFGMIRDQEQGRSAPSRAFKVLLVAIELDPDLMAHCADIARRRWPD